jgi:3'(2'),5'-bisphosphate nucleotidase
VTAPTALDLSAKEADELCILFGRLAVRAAVPVVAAFHQGCLVAEKPDASPVTAADLAAEAIIVEGLRSALPHVPVVTEESESSRSATIGQRKFVLVDPLDGTREFVAHRDEFTINIAMIEDGAPSVAAIYAPLLERLWLAGARSYAATLAPGADLADLRQANAIAVRKPAKEGLVALVSRSHADTATEAFLSKLPILAQRPMGSSLKFCRIAEGAADIYPRFGMTCEWDTAAGHAILAKAGGEVTTPEGQPLLYGRAEAGYRHAGFVAVGAFRLRDFVASAGR